MNVGRCRAARECSRRLGNDIQHLNLMTRPANVRFAGRVFESLAFLLLSPAGKELQPDRAEALNP
uniref:Uncharacterized protein n=1 Tax=Rhizobium leguminosarum TaxID=384 RepID=A0A179BSH8_RHILE|nr:hypothetical protein A4U53_02560 [Rhizobium leguminosarum]